LGSRRKRQGSDLDGAAEGEKKKQKGVEGGGGKEEMEVEPCADEAGLLGHPRPNQ